MGASTLYDFTVTFVGCVLGIALLAASLSPKFMRTWNCSEQGLCLVAALLMIAPGLLPTLAGCVLALGARAAVDGAARAGTGGDG